MVDYSCIACTNSRPTELTHEGPPPPATHGVGYTQRLYFELCRIVDIYLPGDGNDGFYTTCMHSAHTIAAENDCKRGLLSNYKYMFVFGQLLHGMGASPLYTLGVSYLDDNLLPATTSLYVGRHFYVHLVAAAYW